MKFEMDLTNNLAAQDMISIIMEKMSLSEEEAVAFAITDERRERIIKTGWARIAFNLWGHDDPYRKWGTLMNPVFEVNISPAQEQLLQDIKSRYHGDVKDAMNYFLVFAVSDLGCHI